MRKSGLLTVTGDSALERRLMRSETGSRAPKKINEKNGMKDCRLHRVVEFENLLFILAFEGDLGFERLETIPRKEGILIRTAFLVKTCS